MRSQAFAILQIKHSFICFDAMTIKMYIEYTSNETMVANVLCLECNTLGEPAHFLLFVVKTKITINQTVY